MRSATKITDNFIQDSSYSSHFDNYREVLSRLLNHDPVMFALDRNAQIVDVGCGYGDLLKILRARRYKKLIGIEPDSISRKSCKNDSLDVRNGTITRTGLPDNFADVVIVSQVFHHTNNYFDAVDELARILKPGGLLCFAEPSPTLLRYFMDILTFNTNLPKLFGPLKTRYNVMKLEMETGLYPKFLKHQDEFQSALSRNFSPVWHRQTWFFQFGKYIRKN